MSDVKVISHVERMGVSFWGNPYYRVYFEDGADARTSIDSMISYSIDNRDNHGVPVLVSTTKAGRIYNIVKADEQNSQVPF